MLLSCVNQLNPNHPLKTFHTRGSSELPLFPAFIHGSNNVFSARSTSLGLMAAEIKHCLVMLHVINISKALHPQEKHNYVYLIFNVLGFFPV